MPTDEIWPMGIDRKNPTERLTDRQVSLNGTEGNVIVT